MTWTGGNPSANVALLLIDVATFSQSDGYGVTPNTGSLTITLGANHCGRKVRFYLEDSPRTTWTYGSEFTVVCGSVAQGQLTIPVTVAGNAGPWRHNLNPTFDYTWAHDYAPPVVIDAASGLAFSAGGTLTVTYVSGLVSPGDGYGSWDANGQVGNITNPYDTNSPEGRFPAYYLSVPVNSVALVGTFANNGVIVGTPFFVGNGPRPLTIPAGANQLLMGINDRLFRDNTGAFNVTVSGNDGNQPAPVVTSEAASGTYNSTFSYNISATNSPATYSATSLPAGLSVNTTTGAITGTPTETGSFAVNLSATNAGGTGSGTLSLTINKATASLLLSDLGPTYDGTVKSATATTTPSGLTVIFNYVGARINAGSYDFVASISDLNYTGSTTGTLEIAKANATVVVTPYDVEYDGNAHSASVASITGVNGETGATVGTVTLNTTHTNVGVYSDSWSFTGGPNYNNIAATPITDVIKDTTPPVISSVTPTLATLWPANHQMVAVSIDAVASDLAGVTSLKIINVTSNEPDNGLGDGDTPTDVEITGDFTVNLRAERGGLGNGRVYTITVEARDAAGNTSTKTCTVSVPRNQGGK